MEKPAQPLVCALVINYNGRKLLDRLLPTFPATDYPNYRLIVIDNGSTDGSMADFRKAYPSVELLSLEKNQGFSGGNNAGIRHAVKKYSPDYVLLLNNDMEVIEPGWLSEMVRAAEREPKAGVVGCKLLMPGGVIQHVGGKLSPTRMAYHPHEFEKDGHSHDVVRDADFVTGACFLIKREVLEKVGVLDERYNPIYFEDTEYCVRVRRAGYRVIYDGKAAMQHYNPFAGDKAAVSNSDSYKKAIRNRVRFLLFNIPFYWWPVLLVSRVFVRAFTARKEKSVFFSMPLSVRIAALFEAFIYAIRNPSPLNTSLKGT